MNFLRLAEEAGWRTVFLGPAVPIERVLEAANAKMPRWWGLPADAGSQRAAVGHFAEAADDLHARGTFYSADAAGGRAGARDGLF